MWDPRTQSIERFEPEFLIVVQGVYPCLPVYRPSSLFLRFSGKNSMLGIEKALC